MTYTIRRLTSEDVESYRAIRLEALRDHPEAFAAAYETAARKPESAFRDILERLVFFGAIDEDGALQGIVAFARNDGDKEKHRGWMLQMYVRPHLRGSGCALALVEALLEFARHHVIQVHLGVASHNEAAVRLYGKAGFEIYGTEPRYLFVNGRFVDEHLMVRFLDRQGGSDSKAPRERSDKNE